MDKGTRVTITGGRQGKGESGTIFWKGPNKFGEGERFGVRADDGATYWVLEADAEPSDAPAPPPPKATHTFAKGDQVQVTQAGAIRTGSVFWIGESKLGGQRLGVKADDDGETLWADAAYVAPADPNAPRPARQSPNDSRAPRHLSPVDDDGTEYAPVLDMNDGPPLPPRNDDELDRWAESDDDDHGEGMFVPED